MTIEGCSADTKGFNDVGDKRVIFSIFEHGLYCAHFIILHSDEFGQLPPSQIVPRLADCGQYIASESTFYRVLRAENQLKQRRAERPVKQRHKPRALSATAPNQLVSWDITYLPTLVLGVYFTCICSSIFLAAKSLAGKFMIQKAVNWPATSCAMPCAAISNGSPTPWRNTGRPPKSTCRSGSDCRIACAYCVARRKAAMKSANARFDTSEGASRSKPWTVPA